MANDNSQDKTNVAWVKALWDTLLNRRGWYIDKEWIPAFAGMTEGGGNEQLTPYQYDSLHELLLLLDL